MKNCLLQAFLWTSLPRERPLRVVLTFTDTTTSRSRERVGGALEKHIRWIETERGWDREAETDHQKYSPQWPCIRTYICLYENTCLICLTSVHWIRHEEQHQKVFIKSRKKTQGRDGRTLVNNSRVTFHLYLIGQEYGTRFLDKSQSTVLQKWTGEVHWIVQDFVLKDI